MRVNSTGSKLYLLFRYEFVNSIKLYNEAVILIPLVCIASVSPADSDGIAASTPYG